MHSVTQGSGWGAHVYLWQIHFYILQNQYNTVKLNKIKLKKKSCVHSFFIMRNAGLEEAQAGIKIAGRNINNLRYADETTLMAESEEELKSFLK